MVIETEISTGLGHTKVSREDGSEYIAIYVLGDNGNSTASKKSYVRHLHVNNIKNPGMGKLYKSRYGEGLPEQFYSIPWLIAYKVR